MTQRGSRTAHLVGCYLLALAASPHHDALVRFAAYYGSGNRGAERRVVDLCRRIRPQIEYLVTLGLQIGNEQGLELVAGVIRPDRCSHDAS